VTTAAVIAAAVGLVLLFVAWRAVRAFVRLALFGFIALALVAAYVAWRWHGSSDTTPARNERRQQQSAPARR
jgi:membrane protein implicated in regulation of membrane protease activity